MAITSLAQGALTYQHGEITQITLNRPERANACNLTMWQALADLWPQVARDKSCRVIVLRGEGRHFSAGADMAEFSQTYATAQSAAAFTQIFRRAIDGICALPQPVIAQMRGAAIGGGLCLSLACDFRLADPSVFLSVTGAKYGFTLDPKDS